MYYSNERRKRNIDISRLSKLPVRDDGELYGLSWETNQLEDNDLEMQEDIYEEEVKEEISDDTDKLLEAVTNGVKVLKKDKQVRYTTYIDNNLLVMLKLIRNNGGDSISRSINQSIKAYLETIYLKEND